MKSKKNPIAGKSQAAGPALAKRNDVPVATTVSAPAAANPYILYRVKLIAGIVLFGFIASIIYHYYLIHALGKDVYPYNTFLFAQGDRYNDFYNILRASVDLNPYASPVCVYFPFTYIVIHLLNAPQPSDALLIFSVTFIIFFLKYLYSNMRGMKPVERIAAVLILSALSYPVIFILDRGNLEVWVFMSIAMFIYFYLKGKDLVSIIFLAMAISLKLYPAILALVFFIDRKYLLILYTAAASVVLTLFSAAMLEGGIADSIQGQLRNLAAFNKGYISGGSSGLQHNSSLFVPIKLMYYNFLAKSGNYPPNYEKTFGTWYFIIALVLFALLTFIILRYRLVFWKKIALLILTFILLPQISYDYKLINLFITIALFIKSGEQSRFNKYYCIIFGLLLIPKDYYIIVDDLSISSIINPLLMLTMVLLIISEAIKSKETLKFSISGKQ